jgi:hypothetical protein
MTINSDRIDRKRVKSTKMAFGYNDTVWILSVIIWTTGMTAIIMYIKKGGRISINPKKT